MSIVTKTGDQGTTGLYGGERVAKDAPRLHAYGTIDELNSILGVALADPASMPFRTQLTRLQHELFRLGSDLSTPLTTHSKEERIGNAHIAQLEAWITVLERELPAQRKFILPGGTRLAATLHHARTVCRRAERWMVTLHEQGSMNPLALVYVNRLSDYLFLLARAANTEAGVGDTQVEY